MTQKPLDKFLRNLQFHNKFCINFHKSDAIVHVCFYKVLKNSASRGPPVYYFNLVGIK